MKSPSITFLTQLYHPDMTITAIIMTDLPVNLTAAGLRVKVISAQPIYLVDERCQASVMYSMYVE